MVTKKGPPHLVPVHEHHYGIVRTLRCKNQMVPGTLGRLASAIGAAGANIGNIQTVQLGYHNVIRDIDITIDDDAHLDRVLKSIAQLEVTQVLEVRDEVLQVHQNGKIKMVSTYPVQSVGDLRKVYTPGVAQVCNMVRKDPALKYEYTSIASNVAIVTDGTAVLGLGDIGPVAGMPVMEGKAMLLQQLVGLNGIPVLLNTQDTDEIVRTVKAISPAFCAVQLEDISAPRCFDVLARLEKELDIPVMQDDQQGTAVVALAAVINACGITRKDMHKVKIGQVGLGAAGLSVAEMLYKYTGNPVLGVARSAASCERHVQRGGIASSLHEIMETCDIVVALSTVKGLIKPEMVTPGQIIFALSNPDPEIEPNVAKEAGAELAADGRAVNNILGYPGIWRGVADSRAKKLNQEMLMAAAEAIVRTTDPGELISQPLNPAVHRAVAKAVAKAAMTSGVAGRTLDEDYFEN
ncbi:MAG: NAD-dependent malic enzyme [Chloroflexi bacterium]|nr:NAD-dependent malic enzyme [Chloroflexota bacterium]